MVRPQARIAALLAAALILLAVPTAEAKPAKRALPDLVVTKVSKPPTATAGAPLSVSVVARNKGRGAAARSSVGVYLATGTTRKRKDSRLARAAIKPLRAGTSARAAVRLTIPAGSPAGTYHLIACADDARRVREAKENGNCTASAGFQLTVSGRAAPAFSMTDGISWGVVEDAGHQRPGDREPVAVTLRAANGLPGQGGYTRSNLAPQGLLTGATTTLDYSGQRNSSDDGAVSVILPFAFPFGGVEERTVSVGTNGWVGFDGPASDRWLNHQATDYRGASFVLGNFERAIMPYWGDLLIDEERAGPPETITEVVAADGSYVAFQWDLEEFGNAAAKRQIQLVLFPDGRFRFDYPGANTPDGTNEAFVGYSLGTGAAGLETVASDLTDVPGSSILFTPNAAPAAGATGAGQMALTLPPGTRFLTADPGCGVAVAPGPASAGSVTCTVPALGPGAQTTRTVVFAMPHNAPGQTAPPDIDFSGSYATGGVTPAAHDEIDVLSQASLAKSTIDVAPQYLSPLTPQVGTPALYLVKVKSAFTGLDQPKATITLSPSVALNSILSEAAPLNCGAFVGRQITCDLPDGLTNKPVLVEVKVTPEAGAAGMPIALEASSQALNAPPAAATAFSPTVQP